MTDETVLDGEMVALDESGLPSFNALQNFGGHHGTLLYYVFDVLVLRGADLRGEPLNIRRQLLEEKALPGLSDPIRQCVTLDGKLSDLIRAVRTHKFEGLIAKRKNSKYESGER